MTRNGLFQTNVSADYFPDTSDYTLEVIYLIDEGSSFSNNKINFYGLEHISTELEYIKSDFDIELSERYSENKIKNGIENIILTLVNNGYPNVVEDSVVIIIDSVKKTVDLAIYLNTGVRYRVDSIIIEKKGKSSLEVSNDVINDLIDFESNEYLNLTKVHMLQGRLYRTGIFNSVHVYPDLKRASGDLVPIIVDGVISELNELSPEIIGNDERGEFNLGLALSYKRKNFLGDARQLELKTEGVILDVFNFNYSDFFKSPEARDTTFQGSIKSSLKITQPYFFDKHISASFESYYESATIKKISFSTVGISSKINFERDPEAFINRLSPYLNFEYTEFLFFADAVDLDLKIFSYTPAAGLEFGSLKTNSLFYPSTGHNFSFKAELVTSETGIRIKSPALIEEIGSDNFSIDERAWFYSFLSTTTFYFPLSSDHKIVNGLKLKTGYIQTFVGSDELIPPNRTFFVGGTSSIRGWRYKELLPGDTIKYFGLSTDENLRGGTFLLEGSVELRNRFSENFGFVLFTDFGNIWNSYNSFNFSEVALAMGLGIRYYTDIAPFRIDLGLRFYDPGNKKFIWNNWDPVFFNNISFNFGIGEAF